MLFTPPTPEEAFGPALGRINRAYAECEDEEGTPVFGIDRSRKRVLRVSAASRLYDWIDYQEWLLDRLLWPYRIGTKRSNWCSWVMSYISIPEPIRNLARWSCAERQSALGGKLMWHGKFSGYTYHSFPGALSADLALYPYYLHKDISDVELALIGAERGP